MEQVERNLLLKNWKTPLNKDDNKDIYSFFSLLSVGSFNIKKEKDTIRKYVGARRSQLSDVEIKQKSLQISRKVSGLQSFIHSKSIALYSPILNEVETQSIFDEAIGLEKDVYFPRVSGSSLDFYRIQSLDQLKVGSFGVLEPEDHFCKARVDEIDLFIIPGLAFDISGNRLGYGKGYYDRALIDVPENRKVGICYSFQVIDSVPNNKHDQKVGVIVTEKGIVLSRRNLGGE